jgi:hypothetical protein
MTTSAAPTMIWKRWGVGMLSGLALLMGVTGTLMDLQTVLAVTLR